jgi:peptidoglycan/xylan/chitin deacetylase (PgdA/CDA1 family)
VNTENPTNPGTRLRLALLLLFGILLAACGRNPSASSVPTSTPTPTSTATPPPTPTATPLPTSTPIPTIDLIATVWRSEPRVPVLSYHRFTTNPSAVSTAYDMRIVSLRDQLQHLYDNGYYLISLEDWLNGDLRVPTGRRPLLITMDDLFFNNQLALVDGEPDPYTGVGAMWAFSQQHPDFGFHLALFTNLGDKLYANPDDPNWEDDLGEAIAWCLDHGAGVYNHLYTHPRLDMTKLEWIEWEVQMNDDYLRELLRRVGREDLIPNLANIIALPYGMWPATYEGIQILFGYINPEGRPVEAVFEIGSLGLELFMAPPYAEDFDPMHLPRFIADDYAIVYLVVNRDMFPTAEECSLPGVIEALADDPAHLTEHIQQAVAEGRCGTGVYAVSGLLFDARTPEVVQIIP